MTIRGRWTTRRTAGRVLHGLRCALPAAMLWGSVTVPARAPAQAPAQAHTQTQTQAQTQAQAPAESPPPTAPI